MADIKCPMCSKPNSEELDACQFCGARLKPLTAPLDPITPGDIPTKIETSELENTLPGWLRDIRSAAGQSAPEANSPEAPTPESGSAETPSPESPGELPLPSVNQVTRQEPPRSTGGQSPLDMLAGLSQEEDEEEVPDWLAGIRGQTLAPPPPTESQPHQQATGDFLAGLSPEADANKVKPQPTQPEPESDRGFKDSQPIDLNAPEEPASSAEETPDWLADLKAQERSAAAQPEETPTDSESAPIAGDIPDWLSNLGEETPDSTTPPLTASPAETESAPELTPAADMPDWLSSLGQAPTEQPTPAAEEKSENESLDWLNAFNNEGQPTLESSAPSGESLISESDLPDWMANFDEETADGKSETGEATPGSSEQPGSLVETPSVESVPPTAAEPGTPVESPKASRSKPFQTGSLDEMGPLGKTGELPDWLTSLQTTESQTPEPAVEASSSEAGQPAPTTDWLADLNESKMRPLQEESEPGAETAPAAPQAESSSAPSPAKNIGELPTDIPDWLSNFTPSEEAEAGETTQPEGAGADLKPADLPSWVQAMRPVESTLAEESSEEQVVEQQGPLAGMRSVLPANPELLGPRKPKAYPIKLQVDDVQQSQAALLEEILASETSPRVVPTEKRVYSNRVLRWVVAAVLIVAVLVPALAGLNFIPVSGTVPVETQNFYQTLSALPNTAPVLLVFDYQAGFAGEMERSASPVVDQLMEKEVPLVMVSTTLSGPFLADRLIQADGQSYNYQANQQYVNLEYLPGGATGIQAFASNPRATVGQDVNAGDLWSLPPLAHITSLNDFSTVILLSDDPENVRQWLEQVKGNPNFQQLSILVIASAQAQPMILPYYQSGQINGMVSGLEGGAFYEQKLQSPGKAREAWDSYGAGMIAIELVIVVGGLVGLFAGINARRKTPGADEA